MVWNGLDVGDGGLGGKWDFGMIFIDRCMKEQTAPWKGRVAGFSFVLREYQCQEPPRGSGSSTGLLTYENCIN